MSKITIYKPEDSLPEMLYSLRNGKVKGTTTYNDEVDKCWTWRKKEANIWTGYNNEGKAHDVMTEIPTPNGIVVMLDIQVGDKVFDENGNICNVVGISEIFKDRPSYKITFSDGTETIADENHEWLVDDISSRISRTKQSSRQEGLKKRGSDQRSKCKTSFIINTKSMVNNVLKGKTLNYSIEVCKPVEGKDKDLFVHPYILGAWLGDRITNSGGLASENDEIPNLIKGCGLDYNKLKAKYAYNIEGLTPLLRSIGINKKKFIPMNYLTASFDSRLELLKGLMDTDGFIDKLGRCEYTTVLENLANDIFYLLSSLGIKVYLTKDISKLYGVRKKDRYRLRFKTTMEIFKLPRKLERLKNAKHPKNNCRIIKSVEYVGLRDTKCIEVDSSSHMYLCTKSFIPTHNSEFLKSIFLIKALEEGWKGIFCAPEDFPPDEFFDGAIHTLAGMTTDKSKPEVISEQNYLKAYEFIKDKFIFLYVEPPNNSIPLVLEEMSKICKEEKIDVCVIDPLLKFSRPKGYSDRDDIYASHIGSLCTDFCRKEDVSFHLIMHQLTPQTDSMNKTYMEPNVYRIKGGGSWSDGFDNVLSIWRPNYSIDKLDTTVQFSSQKIKKQKLVGIPQKISINFDRKKNRYCNKVSDTELESIFDFDKFMYPRTKKLII